MRGVVAFLVCVLLAAPAAKAASSDVSASVWKVSGDEVVLGFTFPRPLAALLAKPGAPSPSSESISRYVLSRVSVQRRGAACNALDQGYDLGRIDTLYAGPDVFSFEILFRCPVESGPLVLSNESFFDLSREQIGSAAIAVTGMLPVSRLITAGNTAILVPAGRTAEPSGPGAYIRLGLLRTITNIASLCMALGLLLLIGSRRGLALVSGGLLFGYLVAAGAAGLGGWMLQPEPSQAFGGLLLVLVGAMLAVRTSVRPTAAATAVAVMVGTATLGAALLGHSSAAYCLVGAGVFGALTVAVCSEERVAPWLLGALGALFALVDGFSLASSFAPLHSVVSLGTGSLLAYNVGALLGVSVIFGAGSVVRLWVRRVMPVSSAGLYADLLTAGLAGIGVFSMLGV